MGGSLVFRVLGVLDSLLGRRGERESLIGKSDD